MASLTGKKVLLGITGGIAAYKTPDLVRKLKAKGADVRVVLTASAKEFVSPLALQAVSANPVSTDLLDPAAEAAMGHIELARWADIILIAPASANSIARLSAGLADDLLTTICLASQAELVIAPAMNQQMYNATATQHNLQTLRSRGVRQLGPAAGEQACGEVGPGRMPEPQELADALVLQSDVKALSGVCVMITAGPTQEALDPVRYLTNHSSGKMGYALAQAAAEAGAQVILVSGPVSLNAPDTCELRSVYSAEQMLDAVMQDISKVDIFIGCAAVSDYRPVASEAHKIKKTETDKLTLTLIKNPDILANVAALPAPPFTVGFAAETQKVKQYAQHKLAAKKLNMIAANDVSEKGIGFNSDSNALSVFWQKGETSLPVTDKLNLARQLVQLVAVKYKENKEK
ncbi:bifunctional phosphopantothenoylcysteine decarboxylase/phosphopantothenate--cysteine ligase CoaBC [Lacimicrobium sp. SS2-24]|uniref:bifunctional phosphopantothenoylcysteine decarboxylase/phosphopantothenate--cysteine ligase CoaBC n=1 Tax=Lacimicrobium sp. SS2-24 TaxID=2005569 RepID=UPI000B4B36CD|nr:bifunctional phosphopantothenoylcysteine decarboxylase/phosphopantothenate--cysteine ligase CoaBC [Lacimicrobium sp. SS2-24]